MKSAQWVALRKDKTVGYPEPPFDPPQAYPELSGLGAAVQPGNAVYAMVRDVLRLLELDAAAFGTPSWNPLGELVRPGGAVVLKANFVTDFHRSMPGVKEALDALCTHGSVLRPLVDYAWRAVGDGGRIVVCDAPLEENRPGSFEAIAGFTGARAFVEALRTRGAPVELVDLRDGIHSVYGKVRTLSRLPGDPRGYAIIDLGADSTLEEISAGWRRFETGDWKPVSEYHRPGRHVYSIAKTPLSADLVVNVPKLKVHKKSGVTLCLKNMMGISNRKDWIPHWRRGIDETPCHDSWLKRTAKASYRFLSHPVLELAFAKALQTFDIRMDGYGNWRGNDTIWRVQHDLNRILFFADHDGVMRETPQRRYLAVVDGIVGGERDSPLAPTPHPFGSVFGGIDPAAVSQVGARLMGVDWRRLPKIARAPGGERWRFSEVDLERIEVAGDDLERAVEAFEMPPNW